VFFVDDLGWNNVGYHNPTYQTPRIDALAAQGAVFERAYVASPTCSPSRVGLLTGQHPARHGFVRHVLDANSVGTWHYVDEDPARLPSRNQLPLEARTLPERLAGQGYRRIFVGKWHLGSEPWHPIHQGFDEQHGVSNRGQPESYHAPFFRRQGSGFDSSGVPQGKYLTDLIGDEAVAAIERSASAQQPFLLYVWPYSAHTPFQARSDLLAIQQRAGYTGQDAIQRAMVAAVDEAFGRIVDALKRAGVDDNTVIVFLSDQGGLLNNRPLRGSKEAGEALYEGGARVPCFIHGKGIVAQRSAEVISSLDIAPTILELAGADGAAREDLDGLSLVGLLQRRQSRLERDGIFLYRSYEAQYAAMIVGPWKLIAYRDKAPELFNVAEDPGEAHNLASREPARTQSMKARIDEWEKVQLKWVQSAPPPDAHGAK
jgi:arylsulfatase A-like enzyme